MCLARGLRIGKSIVRLVDLGLTESADHDGYGILSTPFCLGINSIRIHRLKLSS